MAEAIQPDNVLIAALWDALEAHTPFADRVKPGNRLKQMIIRGQGARYQPDQKPVKQDADLAELDIDIGPMSSTVPVRTFCRAVRVEEHRQVFIFEITTRGTDVWDALQVKGLILEALRNSTRTLGIPTTTLAVVDWEVTSGGSNRPNKPSTDTTNTGSIPRRVLTMNISIRYRLRAA